MDTVMTTIARGVPALKRGVGAFTHIKRAAIDAHAMAGAGWEIRSAVTADAAERRTVQREHAWVDAAAIAGIRMIPRG